MNFYHLGWRLEHYLWRFRKWRWGLCILSWLIMIGIWGYSFALQHKNYEAAVCWEQRYQESQVGLRSQKYVMEQQKIQKLQHKKHPNTIATWATTLHLAAGLPQGVRWKKIHFAEKEVQVTGQSLSMIAMGQYRSYIQHAVKGVQFQDAVRQGKVETSSEFLLRGKPVGSQKSHTTTMGEEKRTQKSAS